jgi:hypothetical protein
MVPCERGEYRQAEQGKGGFVQNVTRDAQRYQVTPTRQVATLAQDLQRECLRGG